MTESDWTTLSFEDRQRLWTGQPRFFQQHHGRTERPEYWEIQVINDRVYSSHGKLGGVLQQTNYRGKVKNKGKVNEFTPEQDALAEARRDVRKKRDFEGYDEYLGEQNIDNRGAGSLQSILTELPGSFCLYKPENNLYDCKRLLAKAEAGKVLYTVKRDGLAYWIVVDYYGNIQMYSRRSRAWNDKEGPKELLDGTLDFSTVKPWSLRFPHIIEDVRRMGLPPCSMLAGELIWVDPKTGRESFVGVCSFSKSLTEQSLTDQTAKGQPAYYWWDLPFLGGTDLVSNEKVLTRYQRIQAYCSLAPESNVLPIQYIDFPDIKTALEYARRERLEGFVVVDPDGVYGDRAWNLAGKPQRPSCCAKLKPKCEDDFICLWNPNNDLGEWGTGKHEVDKLVTLPSGEQVKHGGVGAVMLHQYNSKGELVPISKCSSGMDYEFQAKLGVNSFPFVAQIEYAERTYMSEGDKTNALRFPVFVRRREDKKLEECVNERL